METKLPCPRCGREMSRIRREKLQLGEADWLLGTVCALPGDYVMTRPLRLVLDRRPFL